MLIYVSVSVYNFLSIYSVDSLTLNLWPKALWPEPDWSFSDDACFLSGAPLSPCISTGKNRMRTWRFYITERTLRHCISYFSITVINIRTKSDLWNAEFILAYVSRELRVHHGGEAGRWAAGVVIREEAWAFPSLTICKRQRASLYSPSLLPAPCTPPGKALPPTPPQAVTPTQPSVQIPELMGNASHSNQRRH